MRLPRWLPAIAALTLLLTLVSGVPGASAARHTPRGAPGPIAFERKPGAYYRILTMNPDGTGQWPLTTNAWNDLMPAWSPDGSQVAFVSDRDTCLGCPPEIYVMNADGSNPVRLTNDPGSDTRPEWSPDGSRIAFASDRAGSPDIWVMLANGSKQTQLTSFPEAEDDATWSPNGARIAFSRSVVGFWDIWL